MPITINLKPYPGAEYFTVKEHQRTFKTLDAYSTEGVLERIVATLRRLHGIPADYTAITLSEGQRNAFQAKYKNLVIRDNPGSGSIDLLVENQQILPGSLLDLSFSFPITAANADLFDAILIDPRASLGIPVETIFLFTKHGYAGIPSSDLQPSELFLMDNVLHDMENKGMEMIMRETNYKAAVLYQLIEDCPELAPTTDKKIRSKTIVSVKCVRSFAEKIEKLGYQVGTFGSDSKIIVANYVTHSKEMIELFSDRIMAL